MADIRPRPQNAFEADLTGTSISGIMYNRATLPKVKLALHIPDAGIVLALVNDGVIEVDNLAGLFISKVGEVSLSREIVRSIVLRCAEGSLICYEKGSWSDQLFDVFKVFTPRRTGASPKYPFVPWRNK